MERIAIRTRLQPLIRTTAVMGLIAAIVAGAAGISTAFIGTNVGAGGVVESLSNETAVALTNPIFINNANYNDGTVICSSSSCTLQTDITAPGTAIFILVPNIVLDLGGHTITFDTDARAGAIGINFYRYNRAVTLGSDNAYPLINNSGNGTSPTIKNGKIIVGSTGGSWAAGIGSQADTGIVTAYNLQIEVNGSDAACVSSQYGEYVVHDIYCINYSSTTENRHQGPASFRLSDAKVTAYNNIIIGGNSAINPGRNSTIYNNVLRHNSFATNGYGAFIYGNNVNWNIKVYNNIIAPSNGRGIIINGDNINTNVLAYDNLITAHDLDNNEYGEVLNATCLRMRYSDRDTDVHDNKCLAIGGSSNTAASGTYLSLAGGMNNYIHDNEFRAILTSPVTQNQYANGITMEGQGSAGNYATDRIENNIFASNNYLVRLDGYDGGAHQTMMEGNTLQWIDGDGTVTWFNSAIDDAKYSFTYPGTNTYVTTSLLNQMKQTVKTEISGLIAGQPSNRSRATFFTNYTQESFTSLHGTTLGSGVGLEAADVYRWVAGRAPLGITIGDAVTVQAKNNGTNIANQTLTLSDNTGTIQTVQTDSSGLARLYPIAYVLSEAQGVTTVSKTARTSQQVAVSGLSSLSLPLGLSNGAGNPYILNFGTPGSLSISADASPQSGTSPLPVTFTGTASGGTAPYTYSWDFGDGQTSTQQSPSHTYASAGVYSAQLTVHDQPNTTAIASVTITVSAPVCTPSWSCGAFDTCSADGTQSRTCTDTNNCGTTSGRPPLTQSCTPPAPSCTPSWSCGAWSTCTNNSQSRTCTDTNNCGQTVSPSLTTQSCISPVATTNDTTAPDTQLVSPPAGSSTGNTTLKWTGSDNATPSDQLVYATRVDDGAWSPYALGAQKDFFHLSNGRHTLAVRARDNAGNVDATPSTTQITVSRGLSIVVASRNGQASRVRTFSSTGKQLAEFFPYGTRSKIGVNVATGDLNGDGVEEVITAQEKGGNGQITISSYKGKRLGVFTAFRSFKGGVNVAVADIDGDGRGEIVAAPQSGAAPTVKVFNSRGNLLRQFSVFSSQYRSGVNLATGDLTGDGKDEIIVAPARSAKALVRVLDLTSMPVRVVKEFVAGPAWRLQGTDVSVANLTGSGMRIFTSPTEGGQKPDVSIFDVQGKAIGVLHVASAKFRGGVSIAAGDVVGYDNHAELTTTTYSGGTPSVYVFQGIGGSSTIKTVNFRAFSGLPVSGANITLGHVTQ